MSISSFSTKKRTLFGLVCCTLIIGGSLPLGKWLGISRHYGVTGDSLTLLGGCLIGLLVLTALIGVGDGHKIHLVARRYQMLHGWIGITTGSLLATGFLAGILALFATPLQQWSTTPLPPAFPLTAPLLSPNDATLSKLNLPPPAYYRITIPNPSTAQVSLPLTLELPLGIPAAQIIISPTLPHRPSLYYLTPTPVPSFIGGLHRRMGLPLPEDWAMPIVGVICLFYGVALLSGVILMLPGMWRNLMTIHLQGRARRLWLDLHSLLGLCSLPFHLIIALTTALFAFFPLLCSIPDTYIVASSKQSSAPCIMPQTTLTQVNKLAPHFQPYRLDYTLTSHPTNTLTERTTLHAPLYSPDPPSHTAAQLLVQGTDIYSPMIGRDRASITLNPYTGAILDKTNLPSQQGLTRRLLTWCLALHFGSFGGEFVRWLYVILALCGVGFFHTANQLWLNTHLQKVKGIPSHSKSSIILWIGRLTEGNLMGSLLGLCGVIALSPLTTHLIPLEHITNITGLASISQTATIRLYQHITLFYYTCLGLSILGCCALPSQFYRAGTLMLSASFLTTALAIVTLRRTAMQNTATCSLTIALLLATISLWGSAIFILFRRKLSSPSHPPAKNPPIPES